MSESLDIAFVLPFGGVGGAEKQTVLLAAALNVLGHRARLVVLKGDLGLGRLCADEGVVCSFLGAHSGADLRAVSRLVDYLRKEGVSAVVCVNFNATLWGRVAAVLARTPTIVDWEHSSRTLALREGRWAPLSNRLLSRVTDAVVACSEAQIPWLIAQGHTAASIRVIPNGTRVPDVTGIEPMCGLPGRVRFAMIASLSPLKDHATFVAAGDRLLSAGADAGFVIVGDGPLRNEVDALVRATCRPDRFAFTGHLAEVEPVLAAVDSVVLASKTEALPLSLIEAMSFGRPVIATDVGGVSQLIENGETGLLVPVGDPDALASAMHVMMDEEVRGRMGPRACSAARERFDIRSVAIAFEALLKGAALPVGEAERRERTRDGSDRVA